MATKMVVYNKKYKKILPETGKLQKFASTILFYWFFNYKHYHWNIPLVLVINHSEFDMFKMASRMVPDKLCLIDL